MTFRRVTLPLIAPGAGPGAFLAFTASFDNIPVSLFLAGDRNEYCELNVKPRDFEMLRAARAWPERRQNVRSRAPAVEPKLRYYQRR
jgi:hypothetical protein